MKSCTKTFTQLLTQLSHYEMWEMGKQHIFRKTMKKPGSEESGHYFVISNSF